MAFYDKEPSAEFRRLNPHIFGPPPAPVEQDVNETKWAKGEEKKLNQLVVADLRRRGYFVIVSRTDKATTQQCGVPDIIAAKDGKIIMVELKVDGGCLSKSQKDCHAQLNACGVPVATCWNFDEAIAFVLKNT